MPVEICGEKAWRKRVKGDIGISYQWVNGEPAMILYPLFNRLQTAGAFVICLSVAHQYAKSNGHPRLSFVIPRAMEAAETMSLTQDTTTIRRIVDIILDGLPDLVDMPPEPPKEKKTGETDGEMIIKVDGETIMEEEIERPAYAH